MASITARSKENFQVEIIADEHRLMADEPIAAGGDDLGPDPYAFLLASVAACKIITIHMYAQRKSWPVESVTATLSHSRIHAKDCEDCISEGEAKVDIIECELHFEGSLDESQVRRLTQIADRCPVHRTLTTETKIRTRAV